MSARSTVPRSDLLVDHPTDPLLSAAVALADRNLFGRLDGRRATMPAWRRRRTRRRPAPAGLSTIGAGHAVRRRLVVEPTALGVHDQQPPGQIAALEDVAEVWRDQASGVAMTDDLGVHLRSPGRTRCPRTSWRPMYQYQSSCGEPWQVALDELAVGAESPGSQDDRRRLERVVTNRDAPDLAALGRRGGRPACRPRSRLRSSGHGARGLRRPRDPLHW